jgi:cation transport ATPase
MLISIIFAGIAMATSAMSIVTHALRLRRVRL